MKTSDDKEKSGNYSKILIPYYKVLPMNDPKTYIKSQLISILKNVLRAMGIGITSYRNLINLRENLIDKSRDDLEFIYAMGSSNFEPLLTLLKESRSQLRQDLLVLAETRYMQGGFFVEFGATNGIDLSNTYLLEHNFMWRGILAEPGKIWWSQLKRNRPKAHIDTSCVWSKSNLNLVFNETSAPELSTVDDFSENDGHAKVRQTGKKYNVNTISLIDLLKKYDAPKHIDYLSIDTEGSEYEILNAFDFSEYTFGVISVEHNFTPQRNKIYDLLLSHGYKRRFESQSHFDDWYTR